MKDNRLQVQELMHVEDILVASPKYINLKGQPLRLPALANCPLLMLEKTSRTR
ncbi:MAG: hypothetical protein ACM3WV_08145 [Bacillota bacterium]